MMRQCLVAFAMSVATTPAWCLQQGDSRFNGFGTLGVTHLGGDSASHGYGITGQTNDDWRGDQLSKLGGQFQYGVTDTVGLTAQATVKSVQDTYKPNLEWLYLSWQANDKLVFRAGRLRTPVYMYSETLDVGVTYPWLRLPDEVYSQVQLSNYEGADAIYTWPLSIGSLTGQLGGGQAKNRNYFSLDDQSRIDYKNIFAANLALATNEFGTVRAGYVEADVDLDIDAVVNTPLGAASQNLGLLNGNKSKFTSIGYQYDNGVWLTADEWTRRVIEGDGSPRTDAFYLMGARRLGDFLVHVTYAQLDQGPGRQTSWTYGLNYSLSPSVTLKGEYKRVDTTGGYPGVFVQNAQEAFDDALNKATGIGAPARNYDGDVISVGLDFVF